MDHIFRKMQMFCFSDHTRMHLHPTGLGPMGAAEFARDLYGAFPVKRLFLGSAASSLFGAGKAVLHPVACDQVRGARGRGQGTETLAKLGGFAA
jgi:hypothetical protein